MKFGALFLLPLLVPGSLLQLNKETISDFINTTGSARGIMFHVSWCGACKQTLPEFASAAKFLSDHNESILAEFDCTDDGDYCATEWGVQFYPQLRFRGSNGPWFALNRYDRTKDGIVGFVRRVAGTLPIVPTDASDLRRILDDTQNRNGVYVSVVLVGEWDLPESLNRLKVRYQFISVPKKELLPLDMRFDDPKYALMVADKSVLVPGTWGDYPRFSVADLDENFLSWLNHTPYPGLWKVEESLFQLFSDQNVYKVFLSQDPLVSASNRTIQSAVADCLLEDKIRENFSFGIVNGPGFAAALNEFEVSHNLGVLVLGKEPLDFSQYFAEEFESVSDDLCDGLERILNGSMTPQYRGSLLSKWNYRYTKFLQKYGFDTELWRVGIIITALFLFIFGLVAGAGRILRDVDPADLVAEPVGGHKKKTE